MVDQTLAKPFLEKRKVGKTENPYSIACCKIFFQVIRFSEQVSDPLTPEFAEKEIREKI